MEEGTLRSLSVPDRSDKMPFLSIPGLVDLKVCKQEQQQLQQQQKVLTEALGDQGDLGQSLLNTVM